VSKEAQEFSKQNAHKINFIKTNNQQKSKSNQIIKQLVV